MIKDADDTVLLDGVTLHTWRDYIKHRFGNQNQFEIHEEARSSIRIVSKTNETIIWFYGVQDKLIADLHYYSTNTIAWSGEVITVDRYGLFLEENVQTVEEILQIPLRQGWSAIEYYLFGKIYKSRTYYNRSFEKPCFVYYPSWRSILTFPIFNFARILKMSQIVTERPVIIEPVFK